MADEFTTLCINKLKAKIEEIYSDYAWYTEYAMHNTKGERISIDLYGETAKSKILIEFEMHRRQPGDNAHKLLILDASRKLLILHIFSPFYEVGSYYSRAKFCEEILPTKFKENDIVYKTYRWNLDKFPSVRKACQVLPYSKKDFPPEKDTEDAIKTLAKELQPIISKWETTK